MTSFDENPTNLRMFYYRPANVQENPALIVAIHYCGGSAQAYFGYSPYANLADQRGFTVLYPESSRDTKCFDSTQSEAFVHDAGGDSLGIANAVRQAISTFNVDSERVFVTGFSSGAQMTNVVIGAYLDLFKAVYAGVPFACFADGNEQACSAGNITRTPQEWGDMVRAAYPDYTGTRPKIQIWHGTNDEVLNYHVFFEEIKQWTNVFNVSDVPTSTQANTPRTGVTRTTYGDNVAALSVQGGTHGIPLNGTSDLAWFGLD